MNHEQDAEREFEEVAKSRRTRGKMTLFSSNELERRGKYMQRAIDFMQHHDRSSAMAVIMSWMPNDTLEDMVDFWEESTPDADKPEGDSVS